MTNRKTVGEDIGLASRPVGPITNRQDKLRRLVTESAFYIERWINLLDEIEGDPDFEPILASSETAGGCQLFWAEGGKRELEDDILDQRHDDDTLDA